MPIIDIVIAVAILISVIIGVKRGFVKESISVIALLVAIWAALFIGPSAGAISENWIHSDELQNWFGRALVFIVVLGIGGVLSWGISKIVRMSALGGLDKWAGSAFGAGRGVLLAAIAVIGGEFGEFDNEYWWQESRLIPHLEKVAEWIKVMAPQGLEILTTEEPIDDLSDLDFELPDNEIVDDIRKEF